MLENSYTKVNSRDLNRTWNHVAGIAAGNFADNKNNNLGNCNKKQIGNCKNGNSKQKILFQEQRG